ncbi:hypothetical protein A1351_16580 [Methylosinus sp. R-45379]|uniref:methyl-accepting chemotaxis protein n=1 Tax=Methylosinus sp. R-45379 TaxID=980563 RepID=UPI0007C8F39E|nr:methyl-accepting chemotaxis protein [Methylosinus sp. R-45379]OAI25408.1 hypothetical protein A1351_16580 [Methylosinus sp. R-45379]
MRGATIATKITVAMIGFSVLPILFLYAFFELAVAPHLENVSFSPLRMATLDLGATINRALGDFAADAVIQATAQPIIWQSQNWRRVDGRSPIATFMNGWIATQRNSNLTMLLGRDGSVLAVNTKDKDGEPLPTQALYAQNFAGERWFVDAMTGKTVLENKRATNVVIDTLIDVNDILPRSAEPDFAFPIAARALGKDGEVIGVWVSFVDLDMFRRYVRREYERMSIVGGDLGGSHIRYDLVDASHKTLLVFQPTGVGAGAFPVEAIGRPAAPMIDRLGHEIGAEKAISRNIDGLSAVYAKLPPVIGFRGLGWSLVLSAPEAQLAATTLGIADRILVAAALTGIVAALGGWRTGSAIARPLLEIASRVNALSNGDKSGLVPHCERRDDVGEMARAVETFRRAAIAKDAADEAAAAASRATEAVVATLAHGLRQLSNGALTHRISEAFGPQYEALRVNFNHSLETLRGGMALVTEAAQNMTAQAGEMAHAADALAQRAEGQAGNLEKMTTGIAGITAALRATAQNAASADALVASARAKAEASGGLVDETIGAMAKIETSSLQVAQILSVIDQLAAQTNLLALNAGVEAARAGAAGRGFAIVAQEVRQLALRSAEAGEEIKLLIGESSSAVGAGVKLVSNVARDLRAIVSEVNALDGAVRQISRATGEQASALQQINASIGELNQMTKHSAAMVEDGTAASHMLAERARALRDMTDFFDVGGARRPPKGLRAA